MSIITNVDWFVPELKHIYIPNQQTLLCIDDPFANRPVGITYFVGIQMEPNAISGLRDAFIQNSHKYDILLAHDSEILKSCSNSKLYIFGTSWILPEVYNNIEISRKSPKISSLTGWKHVTEGHKFRIDLYNKQTSISLPIDWYRSGAVEILVDINSNPILDTEISSKSKLFLDYQYSLVIENNQTPNYFTEKLIDCLITKTIPIYWGCPNIGDWFDTTGWIILETTNIDDLIKKCTPLPDYSQHLSTIINNYETAKKYVSVGKNIATSLGLTSNTE